MFTYSICEIIVSYLYCSADFNIFFKTKSYLEIIFFLKTLFCWSILLSFLKLNARPLILCSFVRKSTVLRVRPCISNVTYKNYHVHSVLWSYRFNHIGSVFIKFPNTNKTDSLLFISYNQSNQWWSRSRSLHKCLTFAVKPNGQTTNQPTNQPMADQKSDSHNYNPS